MNFRQEFIAIAAAAALILPPTHVARADVGIIGAIISPIISELMSGAMRDAREGRYHTRPPEEHRRAIERRIAKQYRGPSLKQIATIAHKAIHKAISEGHFDEYIESEVGRRVAEELKKHEKQIADLAKARQALQILPPRAPAKKGPEVSEAPEAPTAAPAPKTQPDPPAKKGDAHFQHTVIRNEAPLQPQPLSAPVPKVLPAPPAHDPSAARAESVWDPSKPW